MLSEHVERQLNVTKKEDTRTDDTNIFADELFDTSDFEEIHLGPDNDSDTREADDESLFDKDVLDGFAAEFDSDEERINEDNLSDRETEFFQFLADTGKLDDSYVGSKQEEDSLPGAQDTAEISAFGGILADDDITGIIPDMPTDETQVLSALTDIDSSGSWETGPVSAPESDLTTPMPENVESIFTDEDKPESPVQDETRFETAPLDAIFIDGPEDDDTEEADETAAASGRKAKTPKAARKKGQHSLSKRFKILLAVIAVCCLAVVSVLGYNAYQSAQRDASLLQTESIKPSTDSTDSSSSTTVVQPTDRDTTSTSSSSSSSSSGSTSSDSSSSSSSTDNGYYDNETDSDNTDYTDSETTDSGTGDNATPDTTESNGSQNGAADSNSGSAETGGGGQGGDTAQAQ